MANEYLKARAKIIYDPLPGTKYFEPNWMYAQTSFDFIKLYNYFCVKKGWRLDIGSPYGAHISCIKGENPRKPENWKWRNGEWIDFYYKPEPYGDNSKHVWVNVYSDELNEIRRKLGLNERNRFHITIGRLL